METLRFDSLNSSYNNQLTNKNERFKIQAVNEEHGELLSTVTEFFVVPIILRSQKPTDALQIAGYAILLLPSSAQYSFEDKQKNNNGDMMIPITFNKLPDLQREYDKVASKQRWRNYRTSSKQDNTVIWFIFQWPYQHIPVRSESNVIQLLCNRYNCHRFGYVDPGHFRIGHRFGFVDPGHFRIGKTATQKISKTLHPLDHFKRGYKKKWARKDFDPLSFDLVQKKSWSPTRNKVLPYVQHTDDRNTQDLIQNGYILLVKRTNGKCGNDNDCQIHCLNGNGTCQKFCGKRHVCDVCCSHVTLL